MERRSKKKAAKCLRETEVLQNLHVSRTPDVIYYLFKVSDLANIDFVMNKRWFGTEMEKTIARRIIYLIN